MLLCWLVSEVSLGTSYNHSLFPPLTNPPDHMMTFKSSALTRDPLPLLPRSPFPVPWTRAPLGPKLPWRPIRNENLAVGSSHAPFGPRSVNLLDARPSQRLPLKNRSSWTP
jgi:hypothetical protein